MVWGWQWLRWVACSGLLVGSIGWVRGDIADEGSRTVFRTGGEEELLTLALPFAVPEFGLGPVLTFDFGFSTEEPDVGQTFIDSFSVSLQREGEPAAALLLVADRSGISWGPENPQGVDLTDEEVRRAETEYPETLTGYALKVAYTVVLAIPSVLAGGMATVFFDFIDNLNAFASLAWVANVRIGTPVAGDYVLMSASDPAGPYSEEVGALLDAANFRFTTSRPVGRRFYRIRGKDAVRITVLEERPDALRVHYQASGLVLLRASDPAGPYVPDPAMVHDPANRQFVGEAAGPARFWRISGERDTVIVEVGVEDGALRVVYDFVRLQLEAAAEVTGPYQEVTDYFIDESARTISAARQEGMRFFRVRGNASARIVDVETTATEVRLKYALVP